MVEPHFLPRQVAELLRLDPDHVYGLIRSGALPAIDVSARPGTGRARYRIPQSAIDQFLRERAVGRPPDPAPKPRRNTRPLRFYK